MGLTFALQTNQKRTGGGGPPAPPFALNSANEGLSVDAVSGKIQLGVLAGTSGPGSPETLSNGREINVNGHPIDFIDWSLAPDMVHTQLSGGSVFLQNTSVNAIANWDSALLHFFDTSGGNAADYGTTGLAITTPAGFDANLSASVLSMSDGANSKLHFDSATGFLGIGTAAPANDIDIEVDRAGVAGVTVANIHNVGNNLSQFRSMNDANFLGTFGVSNSAFAGFVPLDGGKAFFGSNLTDISIFTQSDNQINFFPNAVHAGSMTGSGNQPTFTFGDIAAIGNGTLFVIDDTLNGVSIFNAELQIAAVPGSAALTVDRDAILIHTTTGWPVYVGAAVGTLTNAPAAGNPTKWIKIDDNGVIRAFPTWQV